MTGKISTVVVDLVMANHMIGTLVVKVQRMAVAAVMEKLNA